MFFFFSSRRRHTRYWRDWSSDVCSSDLSSDGISLKAAYAHDNKYYDFDWSYLKEMFYKGAQLNLIRPRQEGDTLYPELIIFEPDYLIDISSIAHCFTNYAESPLVSLIDRLKPSQN